MLLWRAATMIPKPSSSFFRPTRGFRSQAALDSLHSHAPSRTLVLYNYPSFSGAYAALFAHLYLSRLPLPFLPLPFSSVEPLRLEDFRSGGIETCYLLDFIGPNNFALGLSTIIPRVIAFDHRQSSLARVSKFEQCPENLELRIDTNKSSTRAVHDYFMERIAEMNAPLEEDRALVKGEYRDRVENVMRYIDDADLRQWELPDIGAFNIGLKEVRPMLNCITNPYVFEQLLEIDSGDLISKGKEYVSSRRVAASKLLGNAFKIRLGRGLYGECLAIRADGNSDLSHEIALELSSRSASAGLRPIGAVVFMQRGNLKMCLRSTDSSIDTSEIAKAYGGGGNPNSSSFIIRMDEYNQWTAVNSC
ncbi:Uncharacterized protein M6B38_213755 [Iris pallida]|uniref:Uncharacterized protein n=1 Tax=Iris pallida TaxID=29817 RepID=A0AAX6E2I2_IRIPA|nr:Uncharacterized protein M6B38_213755 [Iris pallida]